MGEDEKGGNMSKIAGDINAEMMKTVSSTQSLNDRLVQEIRSLRLQLADRDEQISDLTISSDTYFAERNSARDVWRRASKDRDELRQQLAERDAEASTAWAQAHRLALELECLIMDTKDNAIVSKWWDSAFEAMEEYHKLKPGAAEDAEAWAKMRKAGI
jgi:ABC-type transporter Mla subunit MlaD